MFLPCLILKAIPNNQLIFSKKSEVIMALRKNPKYDIKSKYQRIWEISLILALGFLIISFKYFPKFEQEIVQIEPPQELIDVEATKQEQKPPPPPKPPIPIEAPTDETLDDIKIEETVWDENEKVAETTIAINKDEDKVLDDYIFIAVEQMPVPIGGIASIQKRIAYPEIARRAGVEGRVFVKAFVDEKGKVIKVELLKGIGAGCDEEALKAVKNSLFIPGKQRGKAVKVQVTVPILFRLQ